MHATSLNRWEVEKENIHMHVSLTKKELEGSRKVCVELQSWLRELELSYHATVNDRDTNFPQVMAM